MKLPATVSSNTYVTYKNDENLQKERKLRAEEFHWDFHHPKTLVVLCIEQLSASWMGNPKLCEFVSKDREIFLQVLKADVPIQILVDNIKNDIFWKRYYYTNWTDYPLLSEQKPWINIFTEKYYADIIEKMNPRQYDPEKVNKLVKLCCPYIESLEIRSLIPVDIMPDSNRITSPEMANLVTSRQHDRQKKNIKHEEAVSRALASGTQLISDWPYHISMHAILGSLTNLVELHLTYQLKFTYDNYRCDQFQFTNNDAKSLARGLERCNQLKVLRITRSDLNSHKLKYILRGMSENSNIQTLDFSHCKIEDEGALLLAKFIISKDTLRNLILTDNLFGPSGIESISHVLNYVTCGLRHLDLRLNNQLGSEGIAHVAVALARGCNLISLNISGCGITPEPLKKPPAGVWSTTNAEKPPTCGELLARAIGLVKTPLRSLDISVNNIGSPSDKTLSNAICLSYLIDVNLKRSGMGATAMAISESAAAAQKLRREEEKGIKFRRSAGRLMQARRVVKGMNIDADPLLLAQQLSARPSIVSVASEEGMFNVQTFPLPSDFGFVPSLKSPSALSCFDTPTTAPSTSRRSSQHNILEPVKEISYAPIIRRKSDGSLIQKRNENRHIRIFVSNEDD